MKGFKLANLALTPMLLLAACASEPREISASSTGISYKYESGDIGEATAKAEKYCARQGGAAKLQNLAKDGGDSVAIFECENSVSR